MKKWLKFLAVSAALATPVAVATNQTATPIPLVTGNVSSMVDGLNQVINAVNYQLLNNTSGGGGDTITSPNGTITIGGTASNTTIDVATPGIGRVVQTKSGNFNVGNTANTDYIYFVSGGITATLAAAAANTDHYTIIDTDGSTITLTGTVNGTTNPTMTITNQSLTFISNGTSYNLD